MNALMSAKTTRQDITWYFDNAKVTIKERMSLTQS